MKKQIILLNIVLFLSIFSNINAQNLKLLIDDFEDMDSYNNLGRDWYNISNAYARDFSCDFGIESQINDFEIKQQGHDSNYATYVNFQLGTNSSHDCNTYTIPSEAILGFNVNFDSSHDNIIDLTQSEGIEFWYKGDAFTFYMFNSNWTSFRKQIAEATDWTLVSINWSDLENQVSIDILDLSDIYTMQWIFTSETLGENYDGEFWLDDVSLIMNSDYVLPIFTTQNYLLGTGVEFKLNITTESENTLFKDFYWQSSDESVAWVNQEGVVTTLSEGIVEIHAISPLNSEVGATSTIHVSNHSGILVDDCESDDNINNLGGNWFTYTDLDFRDNSCSDVARPTINPAPNEMFSMSVLGVNNVGKAASVNFTLGEAFNPNFGGGCENFNFPSYVALGVSLSNFEEVESVYFENSNGVSFWYKGSASYFRVTKEPYSTYYKEIPASEEWTKIFISWESLQQYEWEQQVPFTPNNIRHFDWYFSSDLLSDNYTGQFWVDDIYINTISVLPNNPYSIEDLVMFEGASQDVNITFTPSNTIYKQLVWSSSDSTVAIVNPQGVVTAINSGTAQITATSTIESNLFTTATVVVDGALNLLDTIDDLTLEYATWGHDFDLNNYFSYTGNQEMSFYVGTDNNNIAELILEDGILSVIPYRIGTTTAYVSAIVGNAYKSIVFEVNVERIGSSNPCNNLSVEASIENVICKNDNNGSISVDVSGNDSELTFNWSNGRTGSSISNLSKGIYSVVITDQDGCSATEYYTITEQSGINVNAEIYTPQCGEEDGRVILTVDGGVPSYNYLWNTGSTSRAITEVGVGQYSVTVTDSLNCSYTQTFELSNANAPTVNIVQLLNSECNNPTGSISIDVLGDANSYNFLWNDGETAQNRDSVLPGIYNLTVTDSLGCESVLSAEVNTIPIIQPHISLVTVSSETGNNLVVWAKNDTVSVDYYTIYRENDIAGIYEKIADQPYSELSVFEDETADPSGRSWRYKISATDLCGNETPLSSEHKTILLQQNIGLNNVVNLDWDEYEGINFYSYIIYRQVGEELEEIQRLPSSITRFSDASNIEGTISYIVAVDLPDTINPMLKSESGPFSQALSNIIELTIDSTPIDEVKNNSDIYIYPNPTKNNIFIVTPSLDETIVAVELFNVNMSKIKSFDFNSKGNLQLNLEDIKSGVYYLKIISNKKAIVKSLIIEK